MKYIRLLKPEQYIKNLLIFLPIICLGNFFTKDCLSLIPAFISFCLMASLVYVINDYCDAWRDKKRTGIKTNMFSKNRIKPMEAIIIGVLLFVLSMFFNFLATDTNYMTYVVLLLYLSLNIFYSLILKDVILFDILLLVAFYLFRLYYGAIVGLAPVSDLLYLTVMSAAFYLVFGKRRGELRTNKKSKRKVLMYYNESFLDKFMHISLSLTLVFYSLWVISLDNKMLYFTIPFLFLIFMKYSLDIEKGTNGDPIEVVMKDKTIVALALLYGVIMIMIMGWNI